MAISSVPRGPNAGELQDEPSAGPAPAGGFSRRAFLVRGSLAAGAAAVLGSLQGTGGLLASAGAGSSEMEGFGSAGLGEIAPAVNEPIVAHIADLSSGEISVYMGTGETVVRNPGLAQAIARLATRQG